MSFFRNKTLIVTGASRGIGRALALILAARGVNLVLSARSESDLQESCEACRDLGVRAKCVHGNAAEAEVAERLVLRACDLGDFQGFIHAAGVLAPGPSAWELPENLFCDVMDASVKAAYQLARFSYPPLLRQGSGFAVFFGSGAARKTLPGTAAYCAAKAAEEHYMRQLAAETDRVTAFVYRPGIVETRMQKEGRNAEGGQSENVQGAFRPWKEKGMLVTPEQAAEKLADLLNRTCMELHGKTFDYRELPEA
ncbi:SDR family NAD(P)-dependent oxidoreductase [Paucidesulfovibrio longus]|uniref:SDR family NAD(P)-dependent oxidoreductase n=1 Tax=Paucidesulfovibrio longus TaxID=889 RepID=UPI0003B66754|nr:SDR family NAD(P)-dependent oxidoreductase [Paucidesulfovibrio longus]